MTQGLSSSLEMRCNEFLGLEPCPASLFSEPQNHSLAFPWGLL